WIASYLTGRSYQVAWREAVSAPRALTTGGESHLCMSGRHISMDDGSPPQAEPWQDGAALPPGEDCPFHDLAITVDNSVVSSSQSAKSLGVTLDNTLSF
ncbi:hypothetical protein J4Q44_G00076050, partial [Coregonus suidteri]